jgi:hypothetical protein
MVAKKQEEVENYLKLFLDAKFDSFDKTVLSLHEIIGEVKLHQKEIDRTINDLQLTVTALIGKNHAADCPHVEVLEDLKKKQQEDEGYKKNSKKLFMILIVIAVAEILAGAELLNQIKALIK